MSSISSLQVCTPNETYKLAAWALRANLVPMITSGPGMGKSSLVRQLAEDFNLKLIDLRMSGMAPEDLNGLPRFDQNGNAVFAPFAEIFPLEDAELPIKYKAGTNTKTRWHKGKFIEETFEVPEDVYYEGWLLFLDEFNSANRAVTAAAYKLVLDRAVGNKPLHPRVLLLGAGNRKSDRAIVNDQGTAMLSRLVHLEMGTAFEEWLDNVAIPQNYDSRITAFLSQWPGKLNNFDQVKDADETFNCPRTWEFVNRLLANHDGPLEPFHAKLLGGTINMAVATEFIAFTRIYKDLITIDEILADPKGANLPNNPNLKWATVTMMLEHATLDNLDGLNQYLERFDMSFRILFYKYLCKRLKGISQHPLFPRICTTISNDIYKTSAV